MTSYKPTGYPDLSPYMILDDPEASLQFIEKLFGGERMQVFTGDDGRIRHSEIRIGDAVLMMGGSLPGWPAQAASFHVFVPDVDATFARALELGAVTVQEPAQRDDPHKRGGFAAPGGIVWWVATQVGQG